MPRIPLRPCAAMGCGAPVERGRCPQHSYSRARGRAGQRQRRALLPGPRVSCSEPGSEVDHMVPLSRGGADAEGNVQRLCRRCHRAKTAGERR